LTARLLELEQSELSPQGVSDDVAPGAAKLLADSIEATLKVSVEADGDGVFHV